MNKKPLPTPASARLLAVVFSSVFLLAASAFGQKAAISAEVKGPDGRPAKDATVRLERPDGKMAPIMQKTDAKGIVVAKNMSPGVYRLTATTPAGLRSSQTVKTESNKPFLVTFDIKQPVGNAVAAKKKIFVWRDSPTGTHMLGHWEEVGALDSGDGTEDNVGRINPEALHRMGQGPRVTAFHD